MADLVLSWNPAWGPRPHVEPTGGDAAPTAAVSGAARGAKRPREDAPRDPRAPQAPQDDDADECDVYDTSAQAAAAEHDPQAALRKLLLACPGTPMATDDAAWGPTSLRLRHPPPPCGAATVCDALYWFPLPPHVTREAREADAAARARATAHRKPELMVSAAGVAARRRVVAAWGATQPWWASLTVEQPEARVAMGPPPKPLELWSVLPSAGHVGVPRFWGQSLWGPAKTDARGLGAPMTPGLRSDPSRAPRPEQTAAIDAALASMTAVGGAAVIAACGFGKSSIAMQIAARLGRRTAIIVNRRHLMGQWRDNIRGKPWTWADSGATVDVGATAASLGTTPDTVGDWVRAKCRKVAQHKPVEGQPPPPPLPSGCGAAVYAAHADATPSACPRCGASQFLDLWVPTVEPVDAWVPGAKVGWVQGPWNPTKRRRDSAAPLAHQADTCPDDVDGADFLVMSAHSVVQCGYPRALRDSVGLVIVDEMHYLGAAMLSQVLAQFRAAYRLSMTATPERPDGRELVLYASGGPVVYRWERIPSVTGVRGAVDVRVLRYDARAVAPVYFSARDGKRIINVAGTMAALAADAHRTAAQVDTIRRLLPSRALTLVACDTQARAEELYDALVPADVPRSRAFLLHGDVPNVDAGIAASKGRTAKLIVATFDLLQEGYDALRLDTIVLLTPEKRVKQAVGRTERPHPGKLRSLVVDWVDEGVPQFERWAGIRKQGYATAGFAVTTERIAAAGNSGSSSTSGGTTITALKSGPPRPARGAAP